MYEFCSIWQGCISVVVLGRVRCMSLVVIGEVRCRSVVAFGSIN